MSCIVATMQAYTAVKEKYVNHIMCSKGRISISKKEAEFLTAYDSNDISGKIMEGLTSVCGELETGKLLSPESVLGPLWTDL